MTFFVRPFHDDDWPETWSALETAFRDGESYPCETDITEEEARRYWFGPKNSVYTAREIADHLFAGTYYIRPDQGGLGDHICNCGFVIALSARGKGYAANLCLNAQDEARRLGYLGMKFNLVVSTNDAAIKAWKRAGMETIGVTPNAFRSKRYGLVNAFIMYKDLTRTS